MRIPEFIFKVVAGLELVSGETVYIDDKVPKTLEVTDGSVASIFLTAEETLMMIPGTHKVSIVREWLKTSHNCK